jgi:cytochrome c biogenesis protein
LGLAALRPGESWEIPDGQGTVEFVSLDRFASFRIAHDPGKVLALLAAIAAIIGLSLSLFVRRRRIWVRVDRVAPSAGAGTLGPFRVQVAGLTRSDSADVSGEVDQLVTRLGGPVDVEEGT